MKDLSQEELQDVDRTVRLRQSLKQGVFIGEYGENPHVGFAKCIHGNDAYGCEECKREKP